MKLIHLRERRTDNDIQNFNIIISVILNLNQSCMRSLFDKSISIFQFSYREYNIHTYYFNVEILNCQKIVVVIARL